MNAHDRVVKAILINYRSQTLYAVVPGQQGVQVQTCRVIQQRHLTALKAVGAALWILFKVQSLELGFQGAGQRTQCGSFVEWRF